MSRDKGRARRLSVGASVSFAVAAIAGVVGGRVTNRVTSALVVFVVLVVAGMLVSYWVDHGRRSNDPPDGQEQGSDRVSSLSDLRGAQQTIIASAPGAVAQGALGGHVINHGNVSAADSSESIPRDSAKEERDGQS